VSLKKSNNYLDNTKERNRILNNYIFKTLILFFIYTSSYGPLTNPPINPPIIAPRIALKIPPIVPES